MTRLILFSLLAATVALFALKVAGTIWAAPFAVAVVVCAILMDRVAA